MKLVDRIVQHYSAEQKSFIIKAINGFKECSTADKIIDLKFCDPIEQQIMIELNKSFQSTKLHFFGAYPNAERQAIIITPDYISEYDYPLDILEIRYNQKYELLEHRHVLGTLLNSEIDFKAVGDIIVLSNNRIQIVTLPKLDLQLTIFIPKIARTQVKFVKIDMVSDEIIEKKSRTIIISSNRLDLLVKECTKLSRVKGQELFQQKRVKHNYTIVNNYTKSFKDGDVISIRGYGRFIIENIEVTRTNKIRLTLS